MLKSHGKLAKEKIVMITIANQMSTDVSNLFFIARCCEKEVCENWENLDRTIPCLTRPLSRQFLPPPHLHTPKLEVNHVEVISFFPISKLSYQDCVFMSSKADYLQQPVSITTSSLPLQLSGSQIIWPSQRNSRQTPRPH